MDKDYDGAIMHNQDDDGGMIDELLHRNTFCPEDRQKTACMDRACLLY